MARGSEKILAAWRARLDDEGVSEISQYFEKSAGTVEQVLVHGDGAPGGLTLSVSYSGDDTPQCGNDLGWWFEWLRKHGGVTERPPRYIINGIPWPELITVHYDFGAVGPEPVEVPDLGDVVGGLGGVR